MRLNLDTEPSNSTLFLDLINARPLDVHTWSDYPEVNLFVDDIYRSLFSVEGNERINKRWKQSSDLVATTKKGPTESGT
jgi:hypothetical protein